MADRPDKGTGICFDVEKILTYKMELFDVFFAYLGLSDFQELFDLWIIIFDVV